MGCWVGRMYAREVVSWLKSQCIVPVLYVDIYVQGRLPRGAAAIHPVYMVTALAKACARSQF
jgi:hypothetical protein